MRQPLPVPLALAPQRVLVADDDDGARREIRAVLERDGRFVVCAEAADAAAAVKAAVEERPALCLLAVGMAGGGIEAAWEIKSRLPWAAVVMLAAAAEDADLFGALRVGASGFLLKDMNLARLPHALADAAAGRPAIPRTLVARLVEAFRDDGPRRRVTLELGGVQLTSREWQVLDLLRLGLSTRQIAEHLYVSPATVRSHVAALVRKLAVPDRAALVELFAAPELNLR